MTKRMAAAHLLTLVITWGCSANNPSTPANSSGATQQNGVAQSSSASLVSKTDVFVPMTYNPNNTKYDMYISNYYDLASGKETRDETNNRTIVRFTSYADLPGSTAPSASGFYLEQVSNVIGEIPPEGIRCANDERCVSFGFIDANTTDPTPLKEAPEVGYNTETTNGYSRIKLKPGNVYFVRVQGLKDSKPVNNYARVWVKDISSRGATFDYVYQAEASNRAMQ